MYLHLGLDYMVPQKSIIGIFDLDTTTVTQTTRTFLEKAEQNGQVENVSENLPKSFILCMEKGKKNRAASQTSRRNHQTVVISPLASSTLRKRNQKPTV